MDPGICYCEILGFPFGSRLGGGSKCIVAGGGRKKYLLVTKRGNDLWPRAYGGAPSLAVPLIIGLSFSNVCSQALLWPWLGHESVRVRDKCHFWAGAFAAAMWAQRCPLPLPGAWREAPLAFLPKSTKPHGALTAEEGPEIWATHRLTGHFPRNTPNIVEVTKKKNLSNLTNSTSTRFIGNESWLLLPKANGVICLSMCYKVKL